MVRITPLTALTLATAGSAGVAAALSTGIVVGAFSGFITIYSANGLFHKISSNWFRAETEKAKAASEVRKRPAVPIKTWIIKSTIGGFGSGTSLTYISAKMAGMSLTLKTAAILSGTAALIFLAIKITQYVIAKLNRAIKNAPRWVGPGEAPASAQRNGGGNLVSRTVSSSTVSGVAAPLLGRDGAAAAPGGLMSDEMSAADYAAALNGPFAQERQRKGIVNLTYNSSAQKFNIILQQAIETGSSEKTKAALDTAVIIDNMIPDRLSVFYISKAHFSTQETIMALIDVSSLRELSETVRTCIQRQIDELRKLGGNEGGSHASGTASPSTVIAPAPLLGGGGAAAASAGTPASLGEPAQQARVITAADYAAALSS